MIDLVLYAPDKPTFATFAEANNLFDADGNPKPGLDYCWWAGSGKLMTSAPVIDANGDETTPPQFLPGVALLLRITLASDVIATGTEQWQRSKIARYIETNGTYSATFLGQPIQNYTLSGVSLFRAVDVFDWLAAHSLPGHEWLGGNDF